MVSEYIPILDDGLIVNVSPLVILDTDWYELWYGLSIGGEMTQVTALSPLPLYTIGSPATTQPCIIIEELPASTTFYYKVRRFNHDGKFSAWVTGSFTT